MFGLTGIKLYIAGGIAGIAVIIGVIFWYNGRIDAAELRGKEQQQAQHQKALDDANALTKELEKQLADKNLELDKALKSKNEQVVVTRDRVKTVVETIIQDNPVYQQCQVDQEVIDQLNELRKMSNE